MARTTSYTLSDEHDEFVKQKVAAGSYSSASEIMRLALTRFVEDEYKTERLRQMLKEGEDSPVAEGGHDQVWQRVNAKLGIER